MILIRGFIKDGQTRLGDDLPGWTVDSSRHERDESLKMEM